MIKKCIKCKEGKVDYSMSEVHLIRDTNPQEAGMEDICLKCSTHYYIKFKADKIEVTEFNEFMEEQSIEVINI